MKRKYKLWIALILGIVIPIGCSLIIAYLIFGNLIVAAKAMYELRGQPNTTKDSVASLFLVISSLLGFYSLISTVVFSYLIWKVSDRTLKVTERSEKLEIRRDQEIIRDHALIVYYDLQRGISNLVDLYNSLIIKKASADPTRLYLSTEWMKNVASLRSDLSENEMKYVFRLYEDFLTLQTVLEQQTGSADLKSLVKRLAGKYLVEGIPLPLLVEFAPWFRIESMMSIKLFLINRKIHKATFPPKDITKTMEMRDGKEVYTIKVNDTDFYVGGLDNDGIFNDLETGRLFNSIGQPTHGLSGMFDRGNFFRGKREDGSYPGLYYYIDIDILEGFKGTVLSNVKIYDSGNDKVIYDAEIKNGKVVNGLVIRYTEDGTRTYEGYINDGYREGEGTSYRNGKKYFSGRWEEDRPQYGELYVNGKKIFKGEFKNGQPWEGEALNLNGDSFKQFTGTIKESLPYQGTGYNFRQDQHGMNYVDQQEHDYIDPEIEEEQLRQQIEYDNTRRNEELRNSDMWEEFIKAEWTNGEVKEEQPLESNLKVIGHVFK